MSPATEAPPLSRPHAPPLDAAQEFPDLVGLENPGPPPLLVQPDEDSDPPSLFDDPFFNSVQLSTTAPKPGLQNAQAHTNGVVTWNPT